MIEKNELLELALRRRSVRRYLPEHIDDEIISEIIKVALTAPTSFGHKAVEFVIVRDKDMIRKIGACKTYGGTQINGADAVIVTMVKTEDKRQAEFWIEDGAIASAYILLAAEQYGVGACWVHIRNRMGQVKSSDEEIRDEARQELSELQTNLSQLKTQHAQLGGFFKKKQRLDVEESIRFCEQRIKENKQILEE